MTEVVFLMSKGKYKGFSLSGHAEYASFGKDIVCAAVSMLTNNVFNSIERLTEDEFTGYADEKKAEFSLNFVDEPSHDANLLVDSFRLGIESIADAYGSKYVSVKIQEV
ncbi:MAG: ribosomal-processing cysteine protease Prp [Lachnospiraceae bacterium]|nr:ribosomal-processing cysteine protease Prp [Lachnospiraceae bacterium]